MPPTVCMMDSYSVAVGPRPTVDWVQVATDHVVVAGMGLRRQLYAHRSGGFETRRISGAGLDPGAGLEHAPTDHMVVAVMDLCHQLYVFWISISSRRIRKPP